MPKGNPRDVYLTVSFRKDELKRVHEAAQEDRIPTSTYARKLILAELDRHAAKMKNVREI